jgi:hypothetical protein
MSCVTLSGYTLDCNKSSGGVKKVYLVEFDDVTAYAKSGAGLVTSITLTTSVVFKEYEVQREDSDWTQTFVGSRENRTIAWDQTLRLKIHKNNTAIAGEVSALAKLTGMAIVQNEDGNYWLLGADSGLEMTGTTAYQSGILREDGNMYTIEMGGKEKLNAPMIDSTIIAGLL